MSDSDFPQVGDLIDGRYEILERIGAGGMGAVYKAAFKPLGGRLVALKVLKPGISEDAEYQKRFQREAEIAGSLEHPAIVRVTDFGCLDDGLRYMALEYVQGLELRQLIKGAEGGLPVARAVAITTAVLEALAVAHEAGVIHRDLKPGNIMITSDARGQDVVKVLDFGIARIEGGEALTLAGYVVGTAAYMAPEQSRAQPVDSRADIYAVGCILYEMLTGRPPFTGASPTELVKKHRKQPPADPSRYRPGLPPPLVAAVMRALEKEPARRFASARAFIETLSTAALVPLGNDETVGGGVVAASSSFVNAPALSGETSGSVADVTAITPPPSAMSHSTSLYSHLEGQVLDGKYEVVEKLGEGGMGSVYRARHLMLGEDIALKVMHPAHAQDPTFRERFQREVQVMMKFVHPNAVTVRDFGLSSQGLLYMTLDFSRGTPLSDLIARDAPLSPARALGIARQMLLALHEGHKKGIVHRDIKPDNVLVEKDAQGADHVKVLDFGIAKILQEGEQEKANLTGSLVIGTPHYMSPEQAGGETIDARADVYAVGCVLYEMLCGKKVFEGTTVMQALMAHVNKPPLPISERSGVTVPEAVEALVMRALAKEPVDRYESARAFIGALDALGFALPNAEPLSASTHFTAIAEVEPDDAPAPSSSKLVPALLVLIVLMLGGIAGAIALKPKDDKPVQVAQGEDGGGRPEAPKDGGPVDAPEGEPDAPAIDPPEPPADPLPKPPTQPDPIAIKPVKDGSGKPAETIPAVAREPIEDGGDAPPQLPRPTEGGADEPTPPTPPSEPVTEPAPQPPVEPQPVEPQPVEPQPPVVEPQPTPPVTQPQPEPPAQPPVVEPQPTPMREPQPPVEPVVTPREPVAVAPKEPVAEPTVDPVTVAPMEPEPVTVEPEPGEPEAPATPKRASIAVLPLVLREDSVVGDGRSFVWSVRRQQTDAFTAELTRHLVQMKLFDVVERERVTEALREQDWEKEGRLSDAQRVRFGDMVGAQYLVLGEITKLNVDRDEKDASAFIKDEAKRYTTTLAINATCEVRIVEAGTTRVVEAKRFEARHEVQRFGRVAFDAGLVKTLLDEVREDLTSGLAWRIVEDVYPLELVNVEMGEVYLSRGRNGLVKEGQRYVIQRPTEPIVHPTTGAVIGTKTTPVGLIEVVELDPYTARARILKGKGDLQVGDLCELEAAKAEAPASRPQRSSPFGD